MVKYINKNTPELRNKLLKKGLKMTPLIETKERSAGLLITNTWRVIGVPYDSIDFHIEEYLKNNPSNQRVFIHNDYKSGDGYGILMGDVMEKQLKVMNGIIKAMKFVQFERDI